MSGDWINWHGGECPVPDGTLIEIKFRNGDTQEDDIPSCLDWSDDESTWDIVAYRYLESKSDVSPSAPITSDGGSSDYYKLTIKNKVGEEFDCEMGDIIRHVFGNDFDLGNVVKAARRMYLASLGRGKEGTSIEYDANKIKYFAEEYKQAHKGM